MSGTSTDGIDAAVVDVEDGCRPQLVDFASTPYEPEVRSGLLKLAGCECGADDVARWHFRLGEELARASARVPWESADVVGSHGHTVAHVFRECGQRATLQIGAPAVIAERTGLTVVSDFRAGDVAAGGQGAPLVSFADWLLFRDERTSRAIVNIGGIANVTFVPAAGDPIAFDTGPGNMLTDALVERAGYGRCDRDGELAIRGRVDETLLEHALANPYFRQRYPKTAGREEFGHALAAAWWDEGQRRCVPLEDLVATATALTATTISSALRALGADEIYLAGGGSRNPALVGAIRHALPGTIIRMHDDLGIPADAKECVVFALLAARCLLGLSSSLPSCTGARHAAVLGTITPGPNYPTLMRRIWA